MVAGVDMEALHKRFNEASADLLFARIDSAELIIGRSGLHPDLGIIGEECQDTLYVVGVPRGVVVFYHGHRVCHSRFAPLSRLSPSGSSLSTTSMMPATKTRCDLRE